MSDLEELLAYQLKAVGIKYEREYRFHPTRRWRFDFCWPAKFMAAEIEGGGFVQGRHTRGMGLQGDCEKYNAAALLGYRILRFTGKHVKSGEALKIIEAALK